MNAETPTVLVVAPHPDDETLGCGGTLLRLANDGAKLIWVIVTDINSHPHYTAQQKTARDKVVQQVAEAYPFSQTLELGLPSSRLDSLPMDELVTTFGKLFAQMEPNYLLLPHAGDAHSDHRVVFDACTACSKWFRYPSLTRIMSYETLSETEAALPGSGRPVFQANYFVNIHQQLDRKLEIMNLYDSEMGDFPFPRSDLALESQARLRGAQSGFRAAEAFMVLRERHE